MAAEGPAGAERRGAWALAWLPWATGLVTAWAHHARQSHRDAARALTVSEQGLARAVGVAHPERVRVVVCERMPFPVARLLDRLAGWVNLPGPGATQGLTLGYTLFLHRAAAGSAELLAHECRHVQQFEQAGSLAAFIRLYLRQVARHGYDQAPLEVDARTQAALATKARAAE